MNSYLKMRTFLVLLVLGVFAAAIYPLTPRDFYRTFRENVRENAKPDAEILVEKAQQLQAQRPDWYPASALLEAADAGGTELSRITVFQDALDNSEVISHLRKKAASSIRLGLDLNGGVEFVLKLNPDFDTLNAGGVGREEAEKKLKDNFREYRDLAMEALRKRLEARNIFETEIMPFASRGLSLKAPLVSQDEKDKLRELILMSSKLEFRLVHTDSAALLKNSGSKFVPVGYETLREVAERGKRAEAPSYVVAKRPEMTGNGIDKAFVSRNQYGNISIALRFNREGAKKFAEVTAKNIHRQLAIVLDGKLYCAPVIQSAIAGGQAEITGKFSLEEAENIADALNSGSFPFKIDVEAVYDTAPTLGADNVQNGIRSGLLALAVLTVFMIVYYRKAGVVAVAALAADVVLILGAMATFGATLTMPGIAGIILTLGMAVDANVLVFERMREETEAGKTAGAVVQLGFQRAYSAVMDGNLTTLLIALILMYFGTGAIKGFAVSLAIGIVVSLFTALFMSRVIFDWMLRYNPNMHFTMLRFFSKPSIDFLRQSRIAMIASASGILLTIGICLYQGRDTLSVDFTGGTLLSYQYRENVPVAALEKTLQENQLPARVTYKSNASSADNRKLELLFREGIGEKSGGNADFSTRVRELLNQTYPQLRLADGQSIVIGGMVGAEMTKNAWIALVLALAGMIVYVALRYEFNYALAGILALIHDAIIALGVFLLAGREVSLPVVAGLLTVIGYSINDTIVIFDRIREERHLHPDRPFQQVVNESLNRTLSRTILTSLTTFLVVVVMFLMGGIAINDFMLVIGVGIIVGTYSSIYLASPMIVCWHEWYCRKKQTAGKKA